jgi:hypothetical protein
MRSHGSFPAVGPTSADDAGGVDEGWGLGMQLAHPYVRRGMSPLPSCPLVLPSAVDAAASQRVRPQRHPVLSTTLSLGARLRRDPVLDFS